MATNKHPRLSPSGVEYLDLAWNLYSGCEHGIDICPVSPHCWAKSITQRFNDYYPYGFEPTFYPEAILSPLYWKKTSIIGVGFMGDMFGDWMKKGRVIKDPDGELYSGQGILDSIFQTIGRCPQHTFVFLTKNPRGLLPWSVFPDNTFVGVTACNQRMFDKALIYLSDVEAKHKWLSFEPLLKEIIVKPIDLEGISWVIVGAQTPYSTKTTPKLEWVKDIVDAADKVRVPVFLKKNLRPLFHEQDTYGLGSPGWAMSEETGGLRQEFPSGQHRVA